jgi:hypothetical protein
VQEFGLGAELQEQDGQDADDLLAGFGDLNQLGTDHKDVVEEAS